MKRSVLIVLLLASPAFAQEKPLVVDVWPGAVPEDGRKVGAEKAETKGGVTRISNVTKPTITVFRPAKDKDTGAAVLICPGGGYSILAWDLEGEEVAGWLNSIGVTGIVLKYRVPRPPGAKGNKQPIGPLQDAQRAMSLVRSKASAWNLDAKRIGILGFSAGGHLAAATSTNFDKRAYEQIDDVDKLSCRPDFTVLIYPAYLVAKDKDELMPDIRVTKDSPRTFFAHAGNDGVKADNSVLMYLALKRAGVPSELHVYSTGGHGFGLRKSQNPCSTWPARCGDWLRREGILERK